MQQTTKARIQATRIIYFTLVFVMVLFAGLTIFLKYDGKLPDDPSMAGLLRYVLIVLTPLGPVAGFFLYRQQLSEIDPSLAFGGKYNKFQAAMLIRAGCAQLPGLLGDVAAFITGDLTLLVFTAIIAGLFIYWQPTKATIAEDLNLSPEERRKWEDDEAVME